MIQLALILVMLIPSVSYAQMKHRVWYIPDGTVRVMIPIAKACKKEETPDECSTRIFQKDGSKNPELAPLLQSGEYDDVDPASKPDRADRKYWRGSKATGIIIDTAAREADNQKGLKRQVDKNKARGKLKALGLTDAELEALLER